jgi:hypothetical protein
VQCINAPPASARPAPIATGASPSHLCVRQARQQAVLQLLQLDGVRAQLRHQRGGGLLQVGPLVVNHQRQQLVLQALRVGKGGEEGAEKIR